MIFFLVLWFFFYIKIKQNNIGSVVKNINKDLEEYSILEKDLMLTCSEISENEESFNKQQPST